MPVSQSKYGSTDISGHYADLAKEAFKLECAPGAGQFEVSDLTG